MIKKFLETGKIVGTHGIRGEMRVQPWCDTPQFLTKFKRLYLDDKGTALNIKSSRVHGNIVLVLAEGVNSIEDAEKLRGKVLFISREDAQIKEGAYFIQELIGCTVFDADTDAVLGELCDVSETGANDVWHIKNSGKEYLVPAIKDVVVSVDVENEKIVIRPLKGIFDDED
ncbi:MAG: ribosome maturation factor RimM [Clostridia bacterium]|nr:ribosome maturation factor RimM [Clostridia bacterium]